MKCVRVRIEKGFFTESKVTRVSNEEAKELVGTGKADYIPKKEWKLAGRERGK